MQPQSHRRRRAARRSWIWSTGNAGGRSATFGTGEVPLLSIFAARQQCQGPHIVRSAGSAPLSRSARTARRQGQWGLIAAGEDLVHARLWEISENLHRAELTALERDEHVAEWIRLANEKTKLDGVSSQVGTKLSKRGRTGEGRPESGVRAASRELGIDKDDAHRAVKVAGLSDAAKKEARKVGLDDNWSSPSQPQKRPRVHDRALESSGDMRRNRLSVGV